MKRALSIGTSSPTALIPAGVVLIAGSYGLVRFGFGLLLPEMQAELGLDDATAGVVSAGASLVYCGGAAAGFVLASRHARSLVVAAAAAAGLGGAGMAIATDVAMLAIAAIVSSAAAGLASPALVDAVRRNVRRDGRSRAQTIVNAGTGPGIVAAGALALVVLPDWRLAWWVAAGVTVASAIAVLAADRRRPAAEGAPSAVPSREWFAGHRRLIAGAALLGIGSAAMWNYARVLLVDAGLEPSVTVAAWIALGAGGAATIATAGWLSRRAPRTAWSLTTAVAAAATLAIALAPGSQGVALAASAAFGWGYVAGSGALIAWTGELEPERAPTGTALLFIVLVLGQAIGAALAGALIGVLGHLPAFALAAAATLGASLLGVARRPAPAHSGSGGPAR